MSPFSVVHPRILHLYFVGFGAEGLVGNSLGESIKVASSGTVLWGEKSSFVREHFHRLL
jgi:hypothetical protein